MYKRLKKYNNLIKIQKRHFAERFPLKSNKRIQEKNQASFFRSRSSRHFFFNWAGELTTYEDFLIIFLFKMSVFKIKII